MKTDRTILLVFGVIFLAVASIASLMWTTGSFSTVEADEEQEEEDPLAGTGKAQFCANNPSLDLSMRIEDKLATTKSYMDATVYVQDLEDDSIVTYDINSSDGTFDSVSNALDCLNEEGYKIWVKSSSDVNSNGVVTIEPSELDSNPVKEEMETSKFTAYKVKAYDNNDRTKAKQVSTNSTDYVTGQTIQFGPNSGVGYFDGSSADSLDLTFTLRPNTNSEAFGEMMYIAVDSEDESNLADWDEELTIVEYNGEKLEEADLSKNERRALNSYEKVYAVPETVGMDAEGEKATESTIRLYLEPEADETSNDYDVTMRLVPRGDVESEETDSILENVGFKDDSSRTALYNAYTIEMPVKN